MAWHVMPTSVPHDPPVDTRVNKTELGKYVFPKSSVKSMDRTSWVICWFGLSCIVPLFTLQVTEL